ncbi:MAG: monofunctional biosynthetic peptidoglycan transglycosylase [Burkholderiales bacterium]
MRKLLRRLGRTAAVLLAMAFGYGAYIYVTLPDVRGLRTSNPERTAFQDLRTREARAKGHEPRHVQRWITHDRISPHLKRAVLVAEDAKFWQHEGVDFEALRESIEVNIERREFARGASTITQQLAKNLYLSPSKNPIRKVRELLIARRLEAELTKQRILELYLNVIEWGDGIYGAEAAARTHFGRSAAQVGPLESALLAAALINPRVLDPGRPSARLRRRQQMIARRMGTVTPPPVVAASDGTAPTGKPLLDEPIDPVPELPSTRLPAEVPSEAVAPAAPPPSSLCPAPPCR